jgi:hypothetical protein
VIPKGTYRNALPGDHTAVATVEDLDPVVTANEPTPTVREALQRLAQALSRPSSGLFGTPEARDEAKSILTLFVKDMGPSVAVGPGLKPFL